MTSFTAFGFLFLILALVLVLADILAQAWETMSSVARYLVLSLFLAGAVMVVLGQGATN